MNFPLRIVLSRAVPAVLLGSVAHAQDRFSNFETPQTHPIEIATVDGEDYVLVCNTPDNSVEIYEAASPWSLVKRVPVGLGPASVRWNGALGRFYTCNFDGDSISVVRLVGNGASVADPIVERTSAVGTDPDRGDEPSDIAFSPDNATVLVTLSSQSRAAFFNSTTMAPVGGSFVLDSGPPISGLMQAVKAPGQVAWLPSGVVYVLNLRGGSPANANEYDVGLYREGPPAPPLRGAPSVLRGLGSTNHAFAMNSAGTRMFVVGTKAQNHVGEGLEEVRDLKTGFVQSWLMVVDIAADGTMTVRPEAQVQPLPNTWAPFRSINLNKKYSGFLPLEELATNSALVQPTGVLLIESGGAVTKIVITAFHSDRVAILTPNTSSPGSYSIQRISIPVRSPGSYSVAGPRGLARSATTGLVYANGKLDNTLHVINPGTATLVASIDLGNDPTPTAVRTGRKFLYSNRFSIDDSGATPKHGFVSCASCHVDGRTDGLAWDLSEPTAGPVIEPEFHDGEDPQQVTFAADKGRMMTQTLQGLINYPLDEDIQYASTNAPYYWRGARRGQHNSAEPFKELTEAFDSFNEAFVKLQLMDDIDPDPLVTKGIPDADMKKYRLFVNSIFYPPNPEQDLSRETPGTIPAEPNVENPLAASGFTGAKLGLVLYHNFKVNTVNPPGPPVPLDRTCADCHMLPDGSSSTATLDFPGVLLDGSGVNGTIQTTESSALRILTPREMWLHSDFGATPTHITSNTGLLHPGTPFFFLQGGATNNAQSINSFHIDAFTGQMPGSTPAEELEQILAVNEFVRQLDTGIAPASGVAYTVDPLDHVTNNARFDLLEGQVEAGNIGLAVRAQKPSLSLGYWYDITSNPPGYRQEGSSSTPLSRASILALADSLSVIAQATPLGAERRWASANGTATLLTGPAPLGVTLSPMVPNTAYVEIASLNRAPSLNLSVLDSAEDRLLRTTIWALRTLQSSVVGPSFGVPSVRHEPPRRFRVTGTNIRPGAKLVLGMAESGPPLDPPSQPVEPTTEPMTMDLYPALTGEGELVWETFVELDAMHTFALLNGGYFAPGVADVLVRNIDAFDPAPVDPPIETTLDPNTWNGFKVRVQNEDGTNNDADVTWQVLTIQDAR